MSHGCARGGRRFSAPGAWPREGGAPWAREGVPSAVRAHAPAADGASLARLWRFVALGGASPLAPARVEVLRMRHLRSKWRTLRSVLRRRRTTTPARRGTERHRGLTLRHRRARVRQHRPSASAVGPDTRQSRPEHLCSGRRHAPASTLEPLLTTCRAPAPTGAARPRASSVRRSLIRRAISPWLHRRAAPGAPVLAHRPAVD